MSRIYEALQKAEENRAVSQESRQQPAYASHIADAIPNCNRASNLVATFMALSDELRRQAR